MTKTELNKAIDWLNEYVNRMKDREDYEALKENINRLEQTIRELEARSVGARSSSRTGGTDKLVCP